jgi:SAM-dependent methyltransferase
MNPMHSDPPAFDRLAQLVVSTDIRDRAFAASVISARFTEDRERAANLYARVRETALAQHRDIRKTIHDGAFDKEAFLARLHEAPAEIRDHLVEEILDVAYPPLEQGALPRDAIPYCPSGLAEILFTLEKAKLGADTTFVDLGSGLGKVVLLAALLTGARCYGVELDPLLVAHAQSAAAALSLAKAHFIEGDIRTVSLPPSDVYYMYIPLIHSTELVERLQEQAAHRKILVFASALDLKRLPWLRASNASSYWLEMYESTNPRARALADCERRINEARAAIFTANDGVVSKHMTELEREWRTLNART